MVLDTGPLEACSQVQPGSVPEGASKDKASRILAPHLGTHNGSNIRVGELLGSQGLGAQESAQHGTSLDILLGWQQNFRKRLALLSSHTCAEQKSI